MPTTTTKLISLFGASIFRPNHPISLFPLPPLQFTPKIIVPFASLKLRRHYRFYSSYTAAILDSETISADDCNSSTDAIVAAADSHHPWPEWVIFVDRLKTKGYFLETKSENWDGDDGTVYKDMSILKDVCYSFARDRYDIFKSLSTENMKTLIEKGCPNTFRKTVNSGKRLRAHIQLEEGDVCSGCNLRESCDRANALLLDTENTARTIDVVRILLNFAVDPLVGSGNMCPSRELVELSARKLLTELTELSETIPDPELAPPVARVAQGTQKLEKSSFKEDESSSKVKKTKGDWICPKCNFMNFWRNKDCLKCKEDGPRVNSHDHQVEMKEGDWVCSECNFMNFSRNKRCLKCKENGPFTLGSSDHQVEMKGGDWVCSECKFMNFARNTQCLKCKAKAGKRVESDNVEMKRGDWDCPQCKFMNFAKNIKCLKCKGVRPKGLEVASVEMKKGDWNCPDCHYMNFASNAKCKRCQGPPPPRSQ